MSVIGVPPQIPASFSPSRLVLRERMASRIARATVSVTDLAAFARPVPRRARTSSPGRHAADDPTMLTIDLGDTTGAATQVLLHRRTPTPGDAGVAVSFAVPDVDAATDAAVAAGATVLDPPADQRGASGSRCCATASPTLPRRASSGRLDPVCREVWSAGDVIASLLRPTHPAPGEGLSSTSPSTWECTAVLACWSPPLASSRRTTRWPVRRLQWSPRYSAGPGHLGVGHWISDGLLAIFFIVAVELKHELVAGELNSFAKAIHPAIAAVAGVAVPALVYLAFSARAAGWSRAGPVPTATDIAFALGVLAALACGCSTGWRSSCWPSRCWTT